jgi:hypothetical protein
VTGLFHRLARQVVGPEPLRARTAARLPFAAPPAVEAPQTPRQAVAAPAAGRIDSDPAAEGRRESVLPAPPPLMAPAAQRREDSPPQRDERRAAAEVATAGHAAPVEGPEAEDAAPRAEAAVPSLPTAPARGWDPPTGRAGSAVAGRGRRAEPAATPPPVAAGRPEPLLAEVSPPPAAVRRAQAPAADRASGAGRPDPPEVHVHIGRIEVTSVADPPPSRGPAVRRAPTLSLEDYLAKRRSGG